MSKTFSIFTSLSAFSSTVSAISIYIYIISAIQINQNRSRPYLILAMNQPIVRDFASSPSATSTHVQIHEDTTPGRYTCYDIGTFLALYLILATTRTVDAASEAFEQSEDVLKAHPKIEITDAHAALVRRLSSNVRHHRSEEQSGEREKKRMGSRFGSKVKKLVQDLKGE